MNGPFQPLDDLGLDLDESLVCIDGVCAVPDPTLADANMDTSVATAGALIDSSLRGSPLAQ